MNGSHRDDYLFSKYDLRRVCESVDAQMFAAIDALPEKQLLGTNPVELAEYFAEKHQLELPVLLEDKITVDPVETKRDVSGDPSRFISRDEGPFYIPATRFDYYVPFEGDANLFRCQGNQIALNPPRAQINGQELVLSYIREDHNGDAVKGDFDREFGQLKGLLSGVIALGQEFNQGLLAKATARINARRERLLKSSAAANALGYPMRRREGAPTTYVVPEVKRKLPPQMPKATAAATPEPTLNEAEYEHILSVVENMSAVLERSPATFRTMKEEDLRQHFLVQLNGQYEGQATGETFNGAGKTDILIRVNGRNIFIAECKFWEGPKAFNEAINQLLGYTSWRDTKTALLVFNRGRALSTVLEKVSELVRARPEFVREVPQSGETRFRFVLHHPDDPQRELILTVMVFEMPGVE